MTLLMSTRVAGHVRDHGHARGFTLIELLVVIAIIGILSSVVLASLNSARNKGNDAGTKANLATILVQAEIIYDTDGDYDAVCAANSVTQNTIIAQAVAAAGTSSGATVVCGKPASGAATAYAVGAVLKGGGYWCVDSTGVKKAETSQIGANAVACP